MGDLHLATGYGCCFVGIPHEDGIDPGGKAGEGIAGGVICFVEAVFVGTAAAFAGDGQAAVFAFVAAYCFGSYFAAYRRGFVDGGRTACFTAIRIRDGYAVGARSHSDQVLRFCSGGPGVGVGGGAAAHGDIYTAVGEACSRGIRGQDAFAAQQGRFGQRDAAGQAAAVGVRYAYFVFAG